MPFLGLEAVCRTCSVDPYLSVKLLSVALD
jgi:hypothetical protein